MNSVVLPEIMFWTRIHGIFAMTGDNFMHVILEIPYHFHSKNCLRFKTHGWSCIKNTMYRQWVHMDHHKRPRKIVIYYYFFAISPTPSLCEFREKWTWIHRHGSFCYHAICSCILEPNYFEKKTTTKSKVFGSGWSIKYFLLQVV